MTEKLFNGGIFGTETKISIGQPIISWCEAGDKYLQDHGGQSGQALLMFCFAFITGQYFTNLSNHQHTSEFLRDLDQN